MCAALGFTLERTADLAGLVLVNEGGLTEQAVGQCLRASLPHFAKHSLYFWSYERHGAVAEVDYLIQHGTRIVPVEVKAGTTGSLKSLHHFMARRDLKLAVRINADLPSVTEVDVRTTEGVGVRYRLLSIPSCRHGCRTALPRFHHLRPQAGKNGPQHRDEGHHGGGLPDWRIRA